MDAQSTSITGVARHRKRSLIRQGECSQSAWDRFYYIGRITLVVMMTSSNGNIFRVTGHLCGNSPVSGEFPAPRPVTRSFDVCLIRARINGWVNTRAAGNLRRYCVHYDVIVMALICNRKMKFIVVKDKEPLSCLFNTMVANALGPWAARVLSAVAVTLLYVIFCWKG